VVVVGHILEVARILVGVVRILAEELHILVVEGLRRNPVVHNLVVAGGLRNFAVVGVENRIRVANTG